MRLTVSLVLLFTLLISGCSTPRSALQKWFEPSLPEDSFATYYTLDDLTRQLDQHLVNFQYLRALALIRSAIHQGYEETAFDSNYPEALNGVLNQALLLQQNDQARDAGMLYRTAWASYPKDDKLQAETIMNLTEIDASIELCANRLLEKGLAFYRTGNLEKALEYWEKISEFHPEHKVSLRAIETTRVQLANLNMHQ